MSGSNTPQACFALIDTEYTTWESAMQRNWSGPNEHREVVQVAACGVSSDSSSLIWSAEWYTVPVLNPLLSDYFISLTGITQEELALRAVSLRTIMSELNALIGDIPVYSWGDGDEGSLRDSCAIQGISYSDFLPGIHDIRSYFSAAGIDVTKYQSGTVHSVVGVAMDGKQHNSMYDVQSMFETIRHLVSGKKAPPPISYLSQGEASR